MTGRLAPLALTMGEPAGIGGEIALKAWLSRAHGACHPFLLIDDADRIAALATDLHLTVPIVRISVVDEAASVFAEALPVLDCPLGVSVEPGRPNPAHAAAVISSIETAVALALRGAVAGVVTNPVQKKTLYDAGFPFPGHTEYLSALAGGAHPAVMMLAVPTLRVVPVTVHVSLRRAIDELSCATIVQVARITHQALTRDFGIDQPRLAVAGLNPHAGEQGNLGHEEAEIITPAIALLKEQGVCVDGPFPPDSLFTKFARATYDVAICMYHDQALIPLKTLDFERGVNVTLGLPIVRTSPDHGTALDIAGRGRARPDSLIAALELAHKIAVARQVAKT